MKQHPSICKTRGKQNDIAHGFVPLGRKQNGGIGHGFVPLVRKHKDDVSHCYVPLGRKQNDGVGHRIMPLGRKWNNGVEHGFMPLVLERNNSFVPLGGESNKGFGHDKMHTDESNQFTSTCHIDTRRWQELIRLLQWHKRYILVVLWMVPYLMNMQKQTGWLLNYLMITSPPV